MPDDRRRLLLCAALGFLQLPSRAPELRLLHRWLDAWTGVGLVAVGVERQGLRFSLSHIAEGEWRATFVTHPMFAPAGFGVAPTPWQAVQQAAWAAAPRRRRRAPPWLCSSRAKAWAWSRGKDVLSPPRPNRRSPPAVQVASR